MSQRIGFLGGGRITAIFLEAFGRSGVPISAVVSDADPCVRKALAERFPTIEVTSENVAPLSQDLVFLALHPPVMKQVLPGLAQALHVASTVVSLAPVVKASKLTAWLGGHGHVARMIPNAPSLIGKGFNPIAYGAEFTERDHARLDPLLDLLGKSPEVQEKDLEAYAILAAMGPTYFWFQWQALRELGISFGLSKEAADAAIEGMLHGAVDLQFTSGLSFGTVWDTIPVKPLAEDQEAILGPLRTRLPTLFARLKGH